MNKTKAKLIALSVLSICILGGAESCPGPTPQQEQCAQDKYAQNPGVQCYETCRECGGSDADCQRLCL